MGWSGGTEIADGIWDIVREYIPEDKKKEVALGIIDVLTDQDWDCVQECEELYELSGLKAQDELEEDEDD